MNLDKLLADSQPFLAWLVDWYNSRPALAWSELLAALEDVTEILALGVV